MAAIKDMVFGEIEIKHGWQKKETLRFWGKLREFKIKAAQYGNKEITDTQRKNYQYVIHNLASIADKCKKAAEEYITQTDIESEVDIENALSPRTIIFYADGKYGILFDCAWDTEHGIAVTLPDYQVGPQDILL